MEQVHSGICELGQWILQHYRSAWPKFTYGAATEKNGAVPIIYMNYNFIFTLWET